MDTSRWQFIRTERILASLNEVATVARLQQDTVRGFPGTKARQNSPDPVRIVQKAYTVYVPTHNLLVEAVADNQGRSYNPEIFFDGVEYEQEDGPNNITFTASDGQMYHIQPITLAQHNAKVRCTCLDFFYRFAQTDAKAQALYGKPAQPYHRKTTTHPPANPMRVPGMCKHLITLTEELQRDKVVR